MRPYRREQLAEGGAQPDLPPGPPGPGQGGHLGAALQLLVGNLAAVALVWLNPPETGGIITTVVDAQSVMSVVVAGGEYGP